MKLTAAFLLLVFLAIITYIALRPDLVTSNHQPEVEIQESKEIETPEQMDSLPSVDQLQESFEVPVDDKKTESKQYIVNRDLLPVLFASNDLDALIAGTVLSVFNPEEGIKATHSTEEFLSLALSLKPDDPLLLSVVTLYCGRYGGPHGAEVRSLDQSLGVATNNSLFCKESPYFEMLGDSAGDNAWIWIQRAWLDADDPDLALQHLRQVESAMYYNDYEMEMATVMSGVMEKYGTDVDIEFLTTHALFRSASLGTRHPSNLCHDLEFQKQFIQPCRTMAEYMLDGLSVGSQIAGSTISMYVKGLEEEPRRSHFIKAFDWDAYHDDFLGLMREYPDVRQAYFRNLERYVGIDALNLTMFQYDLIDEMVGEPRELNPNLNN